MNRLLTLLLLLITFQANATTPIDEALNIVFSNNAALKQYHLMSKTIAKQNKWKSSIKLSSGYAEQTTNDYASGFDARAGITFEIPLGENPLDKDQASVILALSKAEQSLKSEFLSAVTDLMTSQMRLRSAIEMHKFKIDKLTYFKEGLTAGITQESELWALAESAKLQEHEASIASREYNTKLEAVSRTYGGELWEKLKLHIIAHIKSYDTTAPENIKSNTEQPID